jgi:hypothetical protein
VLTFQHLGNHGRFGNQLFQIAATIGVALKNAHDFLFPRWQFEYCFKHKLPETREPLHPAKTIYQNGFRYEEINISEDNGCLLSLHGHFQSEKFFTHCADVIRFYFAPVDSLVTEIHSKYRRQLQTHRSCAVYVRRGDYILSPDHHPVQKSEYYEHAMTQFGSDTIFLISSDDPEWCELHLSGKNRIVLRESLATSFFLGTLCHAVIISNSTFGWWAAWLNAIPAKRVIAPRVWFGPAYSHYNISDLIPDGWIVL